MVCSRCGQAGVDNYPGRSVCKDCHNKRHLPRALAIAGIDTRPFSAVKYRCPYCNRSLHDTPFVQVNTIPVCVYCVPKVKDDPETLLKVLYELRR